MQEEWVICRILHKSGDQSSKLMMMTNPYYLPMGMDASSFCFQQDPAAPALPNPSGFSTAGLSFHHGHHPGMHLPPLPANQLKLSNGRGFPASACTQEPPPSGCGGSSNAAMGMPPPYPPPFTSIVAGKPAAPPPQAPGVVNAGAQEPPAPPPTWLEAYVQHGGFLYEMGPAAAPRGA